MTVLPIPSTEVAKIKQIKDRLKLIAQDLEAIVEMCTSRPPLEEVAVADQKQSTLFCIGDREKINATYPKITWYFSKIPAAEIEHIFSVALAKKLPLGASTTVNTPRVSMYDLLSPKEKNAVKLNSTAVAAVKLVADSENQAPTTKFTFK